MTEQTLEQRFEVTNYRYLGLTYLTHGVECEVKVEYRLSPDEPKGARWRTFSSIAANIDLAEYWVQRQVAAWEREMQQKYPQPAPASPWLT